jgi:hypothetical protein
MHFCPYFSKFFVRSGKVGAGSLHMMMMMMMMMMTMSTDELRDDDLRKDCNFLSGAITIPYENYGEKLCVKP